MVKDQFNDNIPPTPLPEDLTGLLVFFHHIEKGLPEYVLNEKLLLTGAHYESSGPDIENESIDEGEQVLGFVLNVPLKDRLTSFLKRKGETLSEQFNFVPVLDGGVPDEELILETDLVAYLLRKNDEPHPYGNQIQEFADFEALFCESWSEVKHVGQTLGHRKNMLVLHHQILMPRELLEDLVMANKADWIKADPDIVFDSSAHMRAVRAFPKLVY